MDLVKKRRRADKKHWNSNYEIHVTKLKKSRIDCIKDKGSPTIYGIYDEFLPLFGQIHSDKYKNYIGIWILAQNWFNRLKSDIFMK